MTDVQDQMSCRFIIRLYSSIYIHLFICYMFMNLFSDKIISILKSEVFPFRNMEYFPIYSEFLSVKNYSALHISSVNTLLSLLFSFDVIMTTILFSQLRHCLYIYSGSPIILRVIRYIWEEDQKRLSNKD